MDERISGESRQSVVRNRKAFRPRCQTGWDEAVANHYVEILRRKTRSLRMTTWSVARSRREGATTSLRVGHRVEVSGSPVSPLLSILFGEFKH
jgi:hypothetical protein